MSNTIKLRKWQAIASKNSEQLITSTEKFMPVNACVGSGKTFVAVNAIGQFISTFKQECTIQMFVTPRIRLCEQQADEIINVLKTMHNLEDGKDYSLVPVNCTENIYNKNTSHLSSKHTVFVICSESLWGTESSIPGKPNRFNRWLSNFRMWRAEGYKFGIAALDEAHNYEEKRDYVVNEFDSLPEFFKVIPLSGTPSAFQKELSDKYARFVCECSPKMAIDNQWIVKPYLNMVVGDVKTSWARAIISVLNREIELCKNEAFMPRIMVNCGGIDVIKALNELEYFQDNFGKKFHFVSLHSLKRYTSDDDSTIDMIEPMIDGKIVSDDEAYSAIEHIDDNSYFNDNLPIIVAQVKMLGEGINVSSFNACITASNSDKTTMQQIGRIIRNYRFNGANKVTDGHANVYVLTDNVDSVAILLKNLEAECSLTAECFEWGKRIDIPTAGGIEDDPDALANVNTFKWEAIDPNNDLDIIQVLAQVNKTLYKKYMRNFCEQLLDDYDNDGDGRSDFEELEELLEDMAKEGKLVLWSKQKTFSAKSERAKREHIKLAIAQAVQNNDKKQVKSEKKNIAELTAISVFVNWLSRIRHGITANSALRRLWSINSKLCIARTVGSVKAAEWLDAHLSAKLREILAK